jgi:hypothetical protein
MSITVANRAVSEDEKIKRLNTAVEALNGPLKDFMPHGQIAALRYALRGEERYAMADVVIRAMERIVACPVTYTQSEDADPVVHLHYFYGSVDAWITEKDKDWPEPGDYDQSFGFVDLMGTRKANAEMGYCSIKEMTESGVELDLYFTPKRWSECK